MKKIILLQFVLSLFAFTACVSAKVESNVVKTDYGTYIIPEGFVRSSKWSTEAKPFYISKSDALKEHTNSFLNNISVNSGYCKYSLENHIQFKDAILRQLFIQSRPDTHIEGDGYYTEQKYLLYHFKITEDQTGFITNQYYIVPKDNFFCSGS